MTVTLKFYNSVLTILELYDEVVWNNWTKNGKEKEIEINQVLQNPPSYSLRDGGHRKILTYPYYYVCIRVFEKKFYIPMRHEKHCFLK